MSLRHLGFAAAVGLIAGLLAQTGPARADDPAFVTLGGGYFDVNKRRDPAGEFLLEYRAAEKVLWLFKPRGGVMGTTDGGYYIYAGLGIDVFFGNRIVATVSSTPGYYHPGTNSLDLGHELEFRSQLEIAYRFDDRSRLGVAVSHMSNAGIGDTNPGVESATVYYSIPIPSLFGE